METSEQQQPGRPERAAIDFEVKGDQRFLSHHDMMRMFARAVIRAGIPVRYSQGFSPKPRFRLPLPRPVGIASEVERLILDQDERMPEADLQVRLQGVIPTGIEISSVRYLAAAEKGSPVRVVYRLAETGVSPEEFQVARKAFLAQDECVITRESGPGKPTRTIEIRRFVDEITWIDGSVDIAIHVTGSGTARPSEVLQALGLEWNSTKQIIHRIGIDWT